MKISLFHKERDLLASALYRLARKDPSPKTAFRVGRILDTIDDDERIAYYQALQARYEALAREWERRAGEYAAGRAAEPPGPRPVAIPRSEILGEAREFTLLDADVETIKRALAEPGWFVGDDGKAVEDLRVISGLLVKFNVEA